MKDIVKDNEIMSKNGFQKNNFVALVLILASYAFLAYLNLIFPTQSDDIGRKLEGIQRAVRSYMHWNGRFGELMLITFGSYFATTPWYAFVNAAVGTSVVMMLFVLIAGRLPQSKRDVAIFSMICMFLMFDRVFSFGSVFYWAAGSFNYLWAWFFILLLVLPVGLFWHGKTFSKTLNVIICMAGIPLGIIAGWSSEFGIVIILFWAASVVFVKLKKKKLPMWYWSSLCAFILGWIILYKCPGHRERAKLFESYLSLLDLIKLGPKGLANRILAVFNNFSIMFYYENFFLVSLFLLLTSLLYKPSLKKFESTVLAIFLLLFCFRSMPKIFFILCALFVCVMSAVVIRKENVFLSNLFVSLSGILLAEFFFIGATIQVGVPRRACFQYTTLNIGIAALNMIFFFESLKGKTRILKTVTVLCECAMLTGVCFVGICCTKMHIKWQCMERSIEQQKAQGITNVVVNKDTFISRYKCYGDWGNPGTNPLLWPNTSYASYYGVETFVAK